MTGSATAGGADIREYRGEASSAWDGVGLLFDRWRRCFLRIGGVGVSSCCGAQPYESS